MTKYKPDHDSFADLANAGFVQGVAVEAGRRVAQTAARIDRSSRADYSARPATVSSGRRNEKRGGAVVTDVAGTGGWDESLRSAIEVEAE